MQESNHIAYRTCIACRNIKPKRELVRFVVASDVLRMDAEQRLPGRGGYICPNLDCLNIALKRTAFARALRTPVRADSDLMKAELSQWLMSKK